MNIHMDLSISIEGATFSALDVQADRDALGFAIQWLDVARCRWIAFKTPCWCTCPRVELDGAAALSGERET